MINQDRSRGRFKNAIQMFEQGTFSCSVRAYYGDSAISRSDKIYFIQSGNISLIYMAEILCFDDMHLIFLKTGSHDQKTRKLNLHLWPGKGYIICLKIIKKLGFYFIRIHLYGPTDTDYYQKGQENACNYRNYSSIFAHSFTQ